VRSMSTEGAITVKHGWTPSNSIDGADRMEARACP
jgi:hypothetical protein